MNINSTKKNINEKCRQVEEEERPRREKIVKGKDGVELASLMSTLEEAAEDKCNNTKGCAIFLKIIKKHVLV